jgi:ubiquinone/menaquinone biosynthesis C-methylase UbiE
MIRLLRKIRHIQILDKLDLSGFGNILDTSCQDSSFLAELNKKYPNMKLFGIDIDVKEIVKSKDKIQVGNFLVSTNDEIPHPDNLFDVVISSMTLHHMKKPTTSLKEMKRVLKKNGKIYLIDITYKQSLIGNILNWIKCREPYHFEKFYSEKEISRMVSNAELRITKKKYLKIFPAISIILPVTIFEINR